MKNRKTLLAVGIVVAAVTTVGLVFQVRWVVDFMLHWSDDLNANALHIFGMTIPLALASISEGLVIREAWHFVKGREEDRLIEVPGEKKMSGRARIKQEVRRQIRETWTLWGVFIGLPLIANVLLINHLSRGVVLSAHGGFSRYATVATMLRSPDPAVQDEGVYESVGLTDRSLGLYLARIIAGRGPVAEHAAWAAGTRGDQEAVVALRWLFLKGNDVQRPTAIIALAKLGDVRSGELASAALVRWEAPQLEIILALGLLTHGPAEKLLERVAADPSRDDILRAAAMWAIGQIEQERFNRAYVEQHSSGVPPSEMTQPERRCYAPMLDALSSESQILRCAAVQALGYSGPVEAADVLMSTFERTGHAEKCQSLTVLQHDLTRVDFLFSGLLRSQIIDTLAKIGNRRIVAWLERQADDRKNADEVILKARDLARQIRNL